MPAKPKWLLRIPEIIEHLRQLTAPVVDRSVIESLFRLRRRQAIELMHEFGGYQAGRTFLIDRLQLVSALEARHNGDDFTQEAGRRERLNAGIAQLRRHYIGATVQIPVDASVFNARIK